MNQGGEKILTCHTVSAALHHMILTLKMTNLMLEILNTSELCNSQELVKFASVCNLRPRLLVYLPNLKTEVINFSFEE